MFSPIAWFSTPVELLPETAGPIELVLPRADRNLPNFSEFLIYKCIFLGIVGLLVMKFVYGPAIFSLSSLLLAIISYNLSFKSYFYGSVIELLNVV